jgi:hypothetical protein
MGDLDERKAGIARFPEKNAESRALAFLRKADVDYLKNPELSQEFFPEESSSGGVTHHRKKRHHQRNGERKIVHGKQGDYP